MTIHQPTRRGVIRLLGGASLAFGGGIATPSVARGAGTARVPEELRPGGSFDRFVGELAAADKFSGTVLLMRRGSRVFSRSYGLADKQRGIANGPATIFTLGSITKMFTAVAVLQNVEQGRLALTDRLGAHLDGFPAAIADTVTIHQLLTHTSGLGDYLNEQFWQHALEWDTVDEVMDGTLAVIKSLSLQLTPGSAQLYSNAGYHLLGTIVAKISGRSYHDYVRERVLAAAGMTNSGFFTRPQWSADRRIAHPYTRQDVAELTDAIDRHVYVGSPAGGAFATAGDLVRFTDALLTDRLLGKAYTELLLSPKFPLPPLPGAPGPAPFQAYGPLARVINGQWTVGHAGGAPGVAANLEWFPDSGWVAVVLSNYDAGATMPIDSRLRTILTQ